MVSVTGFVGKIIIIVVYVICKWVHFIFQVYYLHILHRDCAESSTDCSAYGIENNTWNNELINIAMLLLEVSEFSHRHCPAFQRRMRLILELIQTLSIPGWYFRELVHTILCLTSRTTVTSIPSLSRAQLDKDWQVKDVSCSVYPWVCSVMLRSFLGWDKYLIRKVN